MSTKELSDFLSGITWDALPAQAVESAKMCVEDLIGVALAGSVRPQGDIWRRYFAARRPGQDAHVWDGRLGKAACEEAAALNAAYSHVIDMDDVHNSSITHLGAITIPAALAVGQKYRRSGREVIAAIAAGYEIGARVGESINPGAYHYWHTTGVAGAFSSAVAAGKLMGLTPEQLLHAIGSAGTQAAGLWQFIEDGAMSKTLHTANATLCGIRSAELAGLGFTAARDVLCGQRGFLGAMTADSHPKALTRGLGGSVYKIQSNSFKPYACCRHIHSAGWCVEQLRRKHAFDAAEIVRITDRTYRVAKDNVDDPCPATPYGYKFSTQYCIAAALLWGSLKDGVFSGEKTADPQARALMAKVSVVMDPRLEGLYQADHNQWPHRLEVELSDGSILAEEVVYPYGDFNNPFSWEAEHAKFYSLADGILPAADAEALTRRITHLDQIRDVNDLFIDLLGAEVGA